MTAPAPTPAAQGQSRHGISDPNGARRYRVPQHDPHGHWRDHSPGDDEDVVQNPTPGQGFNAWGPSDVNIAVGPNNVVETTNSQIGIWDKTNATPLVPIQTIGSFLGITDDSCIDPRVIYLPLALRFAMSCFDTAVQQTHFAVSATADPTGSWYKYLPTTVIGVDRDTIIATSDKLIIAGDTGGQTNFWVFPLTSLLAGTYVAPQLLTTPSNTWVPAVYANAASVQAPAYYLRTCSGCGLNRITITGAAGSATLAQTTFGSGDQILAMPPNPAVPGGTLDTNINGTRIEHALIETRTTDSHQVIGFSGMSGCTGSTHTCAYKDVYDLTSGTVTYGSFGIANADVTFASLGLDAAGHTFLSYSYSTATATPSAAAAGDTWNAIIQANTAGTTARGSMDTTDQNERWGDYYSAVQDPSDGTRVWFVAQVQTGNGIFGWGTAFGCGTAAGYGCTGGGTSTVKAQYKNYDTNATDNQIKPGLQLVNTGTAAVPLSQVTVRYWFTHDTGATSYSAFCDFAALNCSNVTRSVTNLSPARTGADAYLQVGFTAGAGSLAAGASTGDLQLRFNKTDFSNFTETDDYSRGTNTTYADSTKVTVYVNGTLVWGTEP